MVNLVWTLGLSWLNFLRIERKQLFRVCRGYRSTTMRIHHPTKETMDTTRYFPNPQAENSTRLLSIPEPDWAKVAQQLFEKCVQKSSRTKQQGSLGGLYVGSLGPSVYLKWRLARSMMKMVDTSKTSDKNNASVKKAKRLLQEALSLVQRELQLFEANNKSNTANDHDDDVKTSPLRRRHACQSPHRRSIVTLLEGSYVGCKAMAAVLHFDLHNDQQQALQQAQQLAASLQHACYDDDIMAADECEVLYGRAGALQALLFLRDALQQHDLATDLCLNLARSVLRRGEEIAATVRHHDRQQQQQQQQQPPNLPLLWIFHHSYYLGAAHGVVGILQMILSLNADELSILHKEGWLEKIRSTIDGLDAYCFPSGNLDSSIEAEGAPRQRRDRLVQWCHGAPGHVMLLVKAAKVFSNDTYLTKAKRIAVDVIWPRGLLRKGVGLCHGMSGNAYALLAIGRDDASFQVKAKYFAYFALTHLAELEGVPDEPYSLYEGLSGLCCLAMDLSCPERARFPLYEF